MSKKNKIYIAAVCCAGLGIVLTAGGILAGGKPGLSVGSTGVHLMGEEPEDYVLEKTALEEFSEAEIYVEYGDFRLIPSDGYYLEYRIDGSMGKPEYQAENGAFTFRETPKKEVLRFQIMDWGHTGARGKSYVNLYVPEEMFFRKFSLDSDSGDGELETLQGENLELDLEYGDLNAGTIQGEQVKITSDSGNFTIQTLKAGELELENEYGEVKAETLTVDRTGEITQDSGGLRLGACEAGDLTISLEYGDLTAESLRAGTLTAESDSGNMKIGSLQIEDKASFRLEYGDVTLGLAGDPEEYTMKLETEYGSVHAPEGGRSISDDDKTVYQSQGTKKKSLEITCESGDIQVDTVKK